MYIIYTSLKSEKEKVLHGMFAVHWPLFVLLTFSVGSNLDELNSQQLSTWFTSQQDHCWSPLLPYFSSDVFQGAEQEALAGVTGPWSQPGPMITEVNISAGKVVLMHVDSLSVFFSALVPLQGYHTVQQTKCHLNTWP